MTPEATVLAARRAAMSIVGRAGIARQDLDDITQDLLLAVARARPLYDSRKSKYNTFVATVIERAVLSVLRARTREHARRVEPLGERDPVDDRKPNDDLHGVRDAVENMPEDIRHICKEFMSRSPAAVFRELGMSRAQGAKIMRRIRRFFCNHGSIELKQEIAKCRKRKSH